MIPSTVLAATPGAAETADFVARFNEIILFPVIIFLTAVALLVFIYGCFLFVVNADNPSGREEGRRHILFGIIGMLVMLMAYTILAIAANTFGLEPTLDCANNPTASGCFTP
jgi:uncharacterized RDD family membrane protein YckC